MDWKRVALNAVVAGGVAGITNWLASGDPFKKETIIIACATGALIALQELNSELD